MPTSSTRPQSSSKSDERTHRDLGRKTHEFERSPYTRVSTSALGYRSSARITTLSQPKNRQDTTVRDGFSRYDSNPKYSGVSHAAANAECTPRLNELASPIRLHKEYQFEWPSPRPVSRGALSYRASSRIHEISAPRKPADAQ